MKLRFGIWTLVFLTTSIAFGLHVHLQNSRNSKLCSELESRYCSLHFKRELPSVLDNVVGWLYTNRIQDVFVEERMAGFKDFERRREVVNWINQCSSIRDVWIYDPYEVQKMETLFRENVELATVHNSFNEWKPSYRRNVRPSSLTERTYVLTSTLAAFLSLWAIRAVFAGFFRSTPRDNNTT